MADAYEKALSVLKSNPVLTALAATTVIGVTWTVNDYTSWKAFGTGGTPPNWAGYWKMTKLRVAHALSSNNLLDPSPLSSTGPSYIQTTLPKRSGRPKIMPRIMPQRQVPESIEATTRTSLQSLVKGIASEHPELLEVKLSHTEGKSTDGLYAKKDIETLNPLAKNKILDHEIAHAHPADNSLHVWLSDVDARNVIEAGWGQRFPLTFVEKGWTMVYAPRNDTELEVVHTIVKAGVGFLTGVEI